MPSLSWRIPTTGDPRLLRIALAQMGLASIVAALVLVVAVPRDWLVPGLLGLIPLAVFMAYFRWVAYRRSLLGSDNVHLDDSGVHWLDPASHEHSFRRAEVIAFQIGRSSDTLRPVPSLSSKSPPTNSRCRRRASSREHERSISAAGSHHGCGWLTRRTPILNRT